MFLSHLSLTHFRNYRQLDLDFAQRLTLLQGRNAQGKTNLLEALYFLATSRPVQAQTEREVVDWQAQEEPIPYSRVAAVVHRRAGGAERPLELEVIMTPRGDGVNYTKQVRINGVGKRSMDLIGLLRAVLFLPEDVKLVDGSPGERRRYLDIALCQIYPAYCRTLSAFQKVLAQRNSLLKNLREQGARPAAPNTETQLSFWDEKLVQHGSEVIAQRHNFVACLDAMAYERHGELTGGQEALSLFYLPSFNYGLLSAAQFEQWQAGTFSPEGVDFRRAVTTSETVAAAFHDTLRGQRARELAAGMTLAGPHRDDLRFCANDHDLRTYGSRGQQRTAALSLKLAEVQAMTTLTQSAPLLLLDDVMSELDAQRRSTLLTALDGVEQVVITTTDWDDFTPEFRRQAHCLHVCAGAIQPATGS